jgi:tetratricopeptide (TPR) repeat protein
MTETGYHGWDQRAPTGIAESLGVAASRFAEWMDAGLIRCTGGDDGEIQIHLADAALVRSLCAKSKLRTTLDRLRAWLPVSSEPMRKLTLVDRRGPLLVRLAGGRLADAAGQFRFDFDPAESPIGRLNPSTPKTAGEWHERGIEQETRELLDDAVFSYTQALLLGGPETQITFDLAYTLARAGRVGSAIERYRQVVELDPQRQDAWVNLGDLLLEDGQSEPAIDAFRRALDLDPADPAAHYNLADALDLAGEFVNARLHWEAFVRLANEPGEHLSYAQQRLLSD